VKVLSADKRVDPSANEQAAFSTALMKPSTEILRILLADDRVVVTNKILGFVEIYKTSTRRVDALFAAAHPRIWPRVIGNDIACQPNGHLRRKLDGLEVKSSWMLLLCVKRRFTPRVAARVGDVLREVCSEWTRYQSKEVDAA
jgi:hypothetical protein